MGLHMRHSHPPTISGSCTTSSCVLCSGDSGPLGLCVLSPPQDTEPATERWSGLLECKDTSSVHLALGIRCPGHQGRKLLPYPAGTYLVQCSGKPFSLLPICFWLEGTKMNRPGFP